MTTEDMWNYLNNIGVSDETLRIVTDINGYSKDTMNSILYAVTGYQDFDEFVKDEFSEMEV